METFRLILILLTFSALDGFWWRAADRMLRPLRAARLWRTLLGAFMVILLGYLLVSAVWPDGVRSARGPIPIALHATAYIWHFIILPVLIVGVIGAWLLRHIARLRRKPTSARRAVARIPASARQSPEPSRRQVLRAAAMAAPPLAAVAWGGGTVISMYGRRLRRFDLRIPGLPAPLEGMTIAHVSDTHVGKFLHSSRLPAIADDINRLNADFVLFTGDLIDASLEDLPAGIAFLRRLKSRCGMAICEGNHDLFDDRGEFEWRMRDAGLPILLSEERTLPYSPVYARKGESYPVQFLGMQWNPRDRWMNESLQYLRPLVRTDAFPILLAHHPHAFDPAARARLPLILAGHTHGGQIMLTDHLGAGPLRFRYISGLYQKQDPDSQLIVNNGIGNWFPVRINAPAEIVHITLHAAPATPA